MYSNAFEDMNLLPVAKWIAFSRLTSQNEFKGVGSQPEAKQKKKKRATE